MKNTAKSILPEVGDVFDIRPYPFVRDVNPWESTPCWKPGVRMEDTPRGDDTEAIADGHGKQTVTVVGTYKPGRFPMRVFFTRTWTDPDGKTYGKGALRMRTLGRFRALIRGYECEYELRPQALIGGAK